MAQNNDTPLFQRLLHHSFRSQHSYAPHLHKLGTGTKLFQELLGHNDIKTTLRYTHVSNLTLGKIKNPFDLLNLKEE
jgi:integrase/recombinase XerD